MEERFIEQAIKDSVERLVSEKIEQEIANKIQTFKRELEDRKDQYIAEVMKGIRIYSSRDIETNGMNYKIIFENVVRLENKG